jgi:DNA replication ATP-dependent helicase Dna2
MITPEDLIEFVLAEQRENQRQQRIFELLSPDALVELGRGIKDLYIRETNNCDYRLECAENESRIRPGSQVLLSSIRGVNLTGEVTAVDNAGLHLEVAVNRPLENAPAGPWFAIETERDFTPLLIQAIRKLQPGAPGWSFFRSLTTAGAMLPARPVKNWADRERILENTLNDLAGEQSRGVSTTPNQVSNSPINPLLDESQLQAVKRCLEEPQLLGVQGPPGTGKTNVLAVVAESLTRLGKRVLVVAPTHQAVNNSLATLRRLFPQRKLIKVGNSLRRESLPDDVACLPLKEAVRHIGRDTSADAVVGMTFLSAIQQLAVQSSGLAPNVVLIDEAGQLPLSQGLCSGLFGAGSVLLFGDDRQMPPVFTADLGEQPLAVSLFTQLRHRQPDRTCMLRTSYRMNREICDFISRSFYADLGGLNPGQGNADRCFGSALVHGSQQNGPQVAEGAITSQVLTGSSPLHWVETPEGNCRQFNELEAESVADVVCGAINSGLHPSEVAVVTPFRRQAAAIRRAIQRQLGAHATDLPIVDTVERVQGLTVELIVVSFCVNAPDYAAEVASFLFSPNRFNVAVSRARTRVVVFASSAIFKSIPGAYRDLLSREQFRECLMNLKKKRSRYAAN